LTGFQPLDRKTPTPADFVGASQILLDGLSSKTKKTFHHAYHSKPFAQNARFLHFNPTTAIELKHRIGREFMQDLA
jgi:hypothetical protein